MSGSKGKRGDITCRVVLIIVADFDVVFIPFSQQERWTMCVAK